MAKATLLYNNYLFIDKHLNSSIFFFNLQNVSGLIYAHKFINKNQREENTKYFIRFNKLNYIVYIFNSLKNYSRTLK